MILTPEAPDGPLEDWVLEDVLKERETIAGVMVRPATDQDWRGVEEFAELEEHIEAAGLSRHHCDHAAAWLRQAESLWGRGKRLAAHRVFLCAVRLFPHDPRVWGAYRAFATEIRLSDEAQRSDDALRRLEKVASTPSPDSSGAPVPTNRPKRNGPVWRAEEHLLTTTSPPAASLGTDAESIASRYHLLHLKGHGGMGTVWEAWDPWLGESVALKFLLDDDNSDTRDSVLSEVRAARMVAHRNVCRVHDCGIHDSKLFIVMEFIPATLADLLAVLKEGYPSVEMLLGITTGLVALHAEGLVHRDLKPSNIGFCRSQDGLIWKILDFGIAKSIGRTPGTVPMATAPFIGTVAYMSPEQMFGAKVGFQSDIYSLGVVAWEAMSGQHPFETDNPGDSLTRRLSGEPLPGPRPVPPELARVLKKCLAPDPANRFLTASELLHALQSVAPLCEIAAPSADQDGPDYEEFVRNRLENSALSAAQSAYLQTERERLDAQRAIQGGEQGDPGAQHLLGCLYLLGTGVPKDIDRGLAWYRKAADQGVGDAQYFLGVLYKSGRHVPEDPAQAAEWYRKAAEQDHPDAQYSLGCLYATGNGVPRDLAQAGTLWRRAGDQGNAAAQRNLGRLYHQGQGVPQDFTQAAVWYRKAADQGDADAQAFLGLLYEEGEGVPQDLAQAVVWYRKAADQGLAEAQYSLGWLYQRGQGLPQDSAQAAVWYRKAADQGDAAAQINLGLLYEKGQGVPQDLAQAAVWLRKAADQGDATAQLRLGVLYETGHGVPRDFAQAGAWLRKAADHGLAAAQYLVGLRYEGGHGVLQDFAQAAVWFRKAADQGAAAAQFQLGRLYHLGQGVPQDFAQAAVWLRKAAEQDDAEAQCNLGFLFANGQGVPQDFAQAAAWYRKAADQAYATAQFNLGGLYYNGQGVPQDFAQAAVWFRKAADLAHGTAQFTLGALYATGNGVPKDLAQATAWYRKAAAQGNAAASAALARLGLSPE